MIPHSARNVVRSVRGVERGLEALDVAPRGAAEGVLHRRRRVRQARARQLAFVEVVEREFVEDLDMPAGDAAFLARHGEASSIPVVAVPAARDAITQQLAAVMLRAPAGPPGSPTGAPGVPIADADAAAGAAGALRGACAAWRRALA